MFNPARRRNGTREMATGIMMHAIFDIMSPIILDPYLPLNIE
jgi:hypothetical protein